MRAWLQKRWGTTGPVEIIADALPVRRSGGVPAKYEPLNKYLTERYADAVTLTFGQIEDVMGSALPELARTRKDWWTTTVGSEDHAQSETWTRAGRTAQPNLGAQTVLFERGASR